jgi:Mn-dependent DtxR family transcriptional regulator
MASDPLTALLAAIAKGPTRSLRELARQLGLDEGLVRQMVTTLAAGGYVYEARRACAAACDGCALREGCSPDDSRLWIVSAKGQRALQR